MRPLFECARVKILRGRTCASALSALLQEKDFTDHVKRGAFSASASVEPGLRPFHTALRFTSRAEAVQKRRVCRAGAARALCAFTHRVSTSVKVRAADGAQWRIWFSN